jgi:hypothetical protein
VQFEVPGASGQGEDHLSHAVLHVVHVKGPGGFKEFVVPEAKEVSVLEDLVGFVKSRLERRKLTRVSDRNTHTRVPEWLNSVAILQPWSWPL